jgi:HAD superfamily hydrolase (TIGR01549 family)
MPIDISRVKAICFDVDGTLCDTDDQWISGLVKAFSKTPFIFKGGNPTYFARWLVMVTESPMNGMYHLLDHLSLDGHFARAFSQLSQRSKANSKTFWIMQGAVELIRKFSDRFPLSVVSARDQVTTRQFLQQFELEKYFREVVTSQTCEFTKPFPHPIIHAAKSMGVNPSECVMIGDTTVDILAGKLAGAQTIGLLCGFGTEKELHRAGADLIVKELVDLEGVFFQK